MLARLCLENPAVLQSKARRRRIGQLSGQVGRVVVGHHDLDRPSVGQARDALQGRDDRLLLVPGSDHDRHRRPLAVRPGSARRRRVRLAVARDQQREDQKADDHAGDVRQQDRDHPRQHRPRGYLQFVPPRLGRPHAKSDPSQRQHQRDGEANSRTKPSPRWPPPRKPTRAPPPIDPLRLPPANRELVIHRSGHDIRLPPSGSTTRTGAERAQPAFPPAQAMRASQNRIPPSRDADPAATEHPGASRTEHHQSSAACASGGPCGAVESAVAVHRAHYRRTGQRVASTRPIRAGRGTAP